MLQSCEIPNSNFPCAFCWPDAVLLDHYHLSHRFLHLQHLNFTWTTRTPALELPKLKTSTVKTTRTQWSQLVTWKILRSGHKHKWVAKGTFMWIMMMSNLKAFFSSTHFEERFSYIQAKAGFSINTWQSLPPCAYIFFGFFCRTSETICFARTKKEVSYNLTWGLDCFILECFIHETTFSICGLEDMKV